MGPTCSIIYWKRTHGKKMRMIKNQAVYNLIFQIQEFDNQCHTGFSNYFGRPYSFNNMLFLKNLNESTTRTLVFMVLNIANIFLTVGKPLLSIIPFWTTLKYKIQSSANNYWRYLKLWHPNWLFCASFDPNFFQFERLSGQQLGISVLCRHDLCTRYGK